MLASQCLAEAGRTGSGGACSMLRASITPRGPALSGRRRGPIANPCICTHCCGVQPPTSRALGACSCSFKRCPRISRYCLPTAMPAAPWDGVHPSLQSIWAHADPRNSSVTGKPRLSLCPLRRASSTSFATGGCCLWLRNEAPRMASRVSPGITPAASANVPKPTHRTVAAVLPMAVGPWAVTPQISRPLSRSSSSSPSLL
mmetsp:Transcript_109952/g.355048  ORF Transcript_109952/g.355048 Transcript_109952/m.355048 type:complete len:201 (-) Transcript_109952:480-1082(-)